MAAAHEKAGDLSLRTWAHTEKVYTMSWFIVSMRRRRLRRQDEEG